MNSAGRVLAKRYHKFRQLNKYLEIVEDCLPHLQPRDGGVLNVVDFGSGRAYLTLPSITIWWRSCSCPFA